MSAMSVPILTLAFLGFAAVAVWGLFKLLKGVFWLIGQVFRGIGWLVRHVFGFVGSVLKDTVHTAGALITAVAVLPLALTNLVIGRFSAAGHYGRALEDELVSALLGVYRVGIAHPLRLVGLGGLLDGLERRLPELVDRAPRGRTKGGRTPGFAGYEIVRRLPEGGSGAQLWLARPRPEKVQRMGRDGVVLPPEVVIKSFAIEEGSTLPQIVRESRALEAARRLGLVYEHTLTDSRFHYVMPYVRGDELSMVIQRLHAQSGPQGLTGGALASALSYSQDLLHHLERFHRGGLWHKDIKPANLIVADERAYLVDFGLVTPLQSAMTLTTHGTEYYRDPEMVRLALQGVKVHEVDGVKFDLYSAGAVLYSLIENSFPAHGSLSRITKRCPEALEWIVRRAMADLSERYTSAAEMRADLACLAANADPFAVRPADLPSFSTAHRSRFEGAPPLRPVPLDAAYAPPAAPAYEPRVRTRRRRGVLRTVAAVMVVGLAFRAVSEAVHDSRGRFPGALAVAHDGFSGPVDWQRFDRFHPDQRDALRAARVVRDTLVGSVLPGAPVPPAPELPAPVAVAADPVPTVSTERAALDEYLAALGRPRSAGDEDPAPESGSGRVLVLEDLPEPTSTPLLGELWDTLKERGFEVLGRLSETLDPAAIQLLAQARNAVGLSGPEDADALAALQAFLDDCADLDAVVWLGPEGASDQHVLRLLVRRDLHLFPPIAVRIENEVATNR